jgi:hypothetical protein
MSKCKNKEREKYTNSQTSRLEKPEELALYHNHNISLFDRAVEIFTMQNALLGG